MINLLKNASEAFNGASGRITVSTGLLTLTRQSAADFFSTRPLPLERGLLVQIEDTGPGIHPDVIDRIFEPFVSTKAVGRGLGLATVSALSMSTTAASRSARNSAKAPVSASGCPLSNSRRLRLTHRRRSPVL
jgi:nitrogen-specific signal transduction histidine kinase